MSTKIKTGLDARTQILRGAVKLAQIVGSTYGPHGRLALLDRFAGLLSTRDGVTVAREVVLSDPAENTGCSLLKQACLKVNDEVGDGTTTAAILTAALLQEGHKQIAGGVDPTELIRQIEEARESALLVIQDLTAHCQEEDDLKQVALISCHDREIAEIIAEGVMAAGEDGTLVVEDGQSTQTELVLKDGMEIDKGFYEFSLTPNMNPDESDKVDGPVVAVIGQRLTGADQIVPILEEASQQRPRPLIVCSPGIEDAAYTVLVYNTMLKTNLGISAYPIEAPGIGVEKIEILKDIAALAGAYFVDPARGDDPRNFKMEYLGAFREARIWPRRSRFIAYDDKIPFIKERIKELKQELEVTESAYKRDKLERRIAKLAGGLCVIKVGGYTEAEMKEKRSRIEDALHATQAAMSGGVVPGGGIALLRASQILGRVPLPGWKVMCIALAAPFKKLAANAGLDGELLIERTNMGGRWGRWWGWDFATNSERRFNERPWLADPTDVVIAALNCACSVASVVLNTSAAILRGSQQR